MSIDQLQLDIKDNIKNQVNTLGALTTPQEIVAHLQNTLWPMLEMIGEEMAEQDGCIEDLMNGSEDILQPETGAKLMTFVTAAVALAGELRRRLQPGDDPKHLKALAEFDALANDCVATLEEITIPEGMMDEDEDPDADEDADEDEED